MSWDELLEESPPPPEQKRLAPAKPAAMPPRSLEEAMHDLLSEEEPSVKGNSGPS